MILFLFRRSFFACFCFIKPERYVYINHINIWMKSKIFNKRRRILSSLLLIIEKLTDRYQHRKTLKGLNHYMNMRLFSGHL